MKFCEVGFVTSRKESLPSRERGLKFKHFYQLLSLPPSLPSRERGLKSRKVTANCAKCIVAPLAGAWIEIYGDMLDVVEKEVAPLAGAWIEIIFLTQGHLGN